MGRIRRLLVPACLLAIIATSVSTNVASAAAGGKKGQRSPAVETSAEACDLRASSRSVHDEWARCIQVSAALSSAPAVGATATLRVNVLTDAARRAARITIELPDNLAFADAPAGARLTTGRASGGVGTARFATTTADLAVGAVRRLTATIRAIAAGPGHIRVRTVADTSWGVDGGSDDIFLTVGKAAADSHFGFDTSTFGGVRETVGRAAPTAAPRRAKVVPIDSLPQPHSDDPGRASAGATSCASGSWHFLDQNGVLRPSINYQVQVWDDDSSSGDDQLVTGVTSFSGTYNLCFSGTDGEGGGQEVYIKFISSNSLWRVRNTAASNSDYVNQTGVQAICDGCNASFGSLMPGNDIHRGMNAFDAANKAWVWVPSNCWDGNDASCRQVVINWTTTSTDGTFYSLAGNDVHLAADDPNAPTVVIHEIGHAIMDDTYEDDYPPTPNCANHPIRGVTSAGCAWTEGFAEWFPAAVLNDPFFRWPDGSSLDLENNTWGTAGWSNGDQVEGRVAGALIDISDFTNEAFWDRYGEGDPGNIWTTFLNNVSDTLAQFWTQRAAGGFNTGNSGANASLYQTTVDFTFRDPVGNYAELARPTPTPHNYSYNTTSVYWSVFAVRPSPGIDYDMTLYDDVGQTVSLGGSAFGSSTVDFVAVDSNHRPLGDYYPRVYQFSGTGNYQVELAQGTDQLNSGSQTVFMGANDVVLVRDTSQAAGVPTFFRVIPSTGAQDPELFLMQSDGANSATWVRSRGAAVASSTANGAGAAEGFSFTPPASDWYGLVLTNKAGSGNYTLHVDTSAPTGTIDINGGAAATNSTAATANLGGSDAQTSVEAVRISTDGTMDAETFVPFSASQPVMLPGGDGTKTVLAQFRNGAGMVSPVVSDTILLDTVLPSSTNPVISVPKNSQLLAGARVNVRATWSASDADSGVASHELELSSDGGGTWSPVSLPTPTTTQRGVNLTRGSTQYEFRTRATDVAGNVGPFANSPTFEVRVHQESSNLITLTPGWTIVSDANADGGQLARTSEAGRRATASVGDARVLAIVGRKGPDAGKINVFLDGVKIGSSDLYSATEVNRVVLFTTAVTPGLPHEIQMRVQSGKNPASSGTVVTLDAVVRLV